MRIATVLGIVLACALSTVAQAPAAKSKAAPAVAPAEQPTVQQILDRYVAALGGRQAYERVTSRILRGTADMKMGPDALPKGKVVVLSKAPDRMRLTFDVEGIVVEEGFDGATAWEFNSVDGGVRIRRGERAEKARLDAQFHSDTRLAELFPEMTFIGAGSVEGRRTHRVQASPKEGLKRIYHFSVATGLIVRIEDELMEAGRLERHTTDLRSYQAFDGVKIPMVMHSETPDWVITISFTDVQQNVHIDEARFKRPKAEPR